MRLWEDGLIAALAAVGVASIMWAVVRRVLFAELPRQRGAVALIPAQGGGEALESQLRALERLRGEQGVFGEILVVDCGLDDQGRQLARCLAREDRWVSVCAPEDIASHLT